MNRYRTTLLIFAVIALNLLLRLLPFNQVFTGGNITLVDGDSYYHMRRILLIAENFPHVPVFDYYMNFPEGARVPWPPLFDLLIAATAFLAGFGSPSVKMVETIAAIAPPVLGALTVIPLYFLAKRLFDQKIALLSIFFFSLVRGHILYTTVGRPDHHAVEPLILTVFLFIIVASVQDYDKRKYPVLLPVLGGTILTAGMLVWTGSIIYLAVAVFALLPLVVMGNAKDPTPVFTTISIVSLTSSLFLSLYLAVSGTWRPFSYITLSGFHANMISFAAAFTASLWYVSRLFQKRNVPWPYLMLAAPAIAALLSVLVYFLSPEMVQPLSDGIFKQIGKEVPWRRVISESRPLFSETTAGGYRFSLRNGIEMGGFSILFVPFALLLLLFEKKDREKKLVFVLLSLPFFGLTLNQMRYIYYSSLFIGIINAYLMSRFMEMNPGKGWTALIAIAFIGFFQPTFEKSFQHIKRPHGALLNRMGRDGLETLLWLRENTPQGGPEYSIMNAWSYGHEITYISSRPVVTNNFADVIGGSGFHDSLMFFASVSEDETYALMERHASRYAILESPVSALAYSLKMQGRRMPDYFTETWQPTERAIKEVITCRLYYFDGKDIGRYRLVYESRVPVSYRTKIFNDLKRYKIFEFVKGAKLKGMARPGSLITATVPLISNRNREFVYENVAVADNKGVFEMVLPYSTKGTPYQVRTRQGYLVNTGSMRKMIEVSEDDVINGSDLYAD